MKHKCDFCDKEYTEGGIKYHIKYCKKNPNKVDLPNKSELWKEKQKTRKISNGYIAAKERGDVFEMTESTRKKISEASKGRKHSEKTKKLISEQKKKLYASGWECTAGRCPKYDYDSPIAGSIKVDGSWELKFCEFADKYDLKWTRNKKRFDYIRPNGKLSTYQPDFYIEDFKTYIEVKGYETDLDKCKWGQFPDSLIVLRRNEIFDLDKWFNIYLEDYTNGK